MPRTPAPLGPEPHPDGADRRHGQVPVARAGQRRAGRRPHRRLRPRRRALRDALRPAAVRRRDRRGHRAAARLQPTPARPARCGPAIPRRSRTVVLRAMAKAPDDRYATGGRAAERPAVGRPRAPTTTDRPPPPCPPRAPRRPGGVRRRFAAERAVAGWCRVVLIVVLAVTLGIVGVLFARTDDGAATCSTAPTRAPASGPPVAIRTRRGLRPPPGSGGEHDDELPNLHRRRPGHRRGRTERYADRAFGGLKPGVGFVARSSTAPAELGRAPGRRPPHRVDGGGLRGRRAQDARSASGASRSPTKSGVDGRRHLRPRRHARRGRAGVDHRPRRGQRLGRGRARSVLTG